MGRLSPWPLRAAGDLPSRAAAHAHCDNGTARPRTPSHAHPHALAHQHARPHGWMRVRAQATDARDRYMGDDLTVRQQIINEVRNACACTQRAHTRCAHHGLA